MCYFSGFGSVPMNVRTFTSPAATFVFCAIIAWAAYASAQNDAARNLSPAQRAVVEQLRQELGKYRLKEDHCNVFDTSKEQFYRYFTMPYQVGRHIVFSPNWNAYVGTQVSPAQMLAFRNRADEIFETYSKLVGPPALGKKVLIDVTPMLDRESIQNTGAHAHYSVNQICYNAVHIEGTLSAIKRGDYSHTLMHELGHTFSNGREWNINPESWSEFFPCFALEINPRIWFEYNNMAYVNKNSKPVLTRGKLHRVQVLGAIEFLYKTGTLQKYGVEGNEYQKGIYDFYLYGLVGKVGWGVYKKAFQSYENDSFKSRYEYEGDKKDVTALDFFERIAYFSEDRKNILKSLPDQGELLQAFDVRVTSLETLAKMTKEEKREHEELKRIRSLNGNEKAEAIAKFNYRKAVEVAEEKIRKIRDERQKMLKSGSLSDRDKAIRSIKLFYREQIANADLSRIKMAGVNATPEEQKQAEDAKDTLVKKYRNEEKQALSPENIEKSVEAEMRKIKNEKDDA